MISRLKSLISRFRAPSKDQLLQIQKGSGSQTLTPASQVSHPGEGEARLLTLTPITPESFQIWPLREVIADAVKEIRTQMSGMPGAGRGMRVEMDASVQEAHVLLKMQKPKLKKALVSLLEQSLKGMGELQGKEGLIIIRVAKGEGAVSVHILDNGKGYADLQTVRSFPGVTQIRELLEAWGGEVSLASAVGKGTKVTLRFLTKT